MNQAKNVLAAAMLAAAIPAAPAADAAKPRSNEPRPAAAAPDFAEHVDPYIETGGHYTRWFYFNAPMRPFGLANPRPDTHLVCTKTDTNKRGPGFYYDGEDILGVSHINGYLVPGGLEVMPVCGDIDPRSGPNGWKSPHAHEGEIAKPGYQKLRLPRYDMGLELTATCRVAWHRYTFDKPGAGGVIFMNGGRIGEGHGSRPGMIRKTGPREVEGFAYIMWNNSVKLHFVAQMDRDIEQFQIWDGEEFLPGDEKTWPAPTAKSDFPIAGAKVAFPINAGDKVTMKIGLSYVSLDGARKNLAAESPDWDFDAVRADARREWNEYLGAITVDGGTEAQRIKFYTDQYRTAIGRHRIEDCDGAYSVSGGIKQLPLDAAGRPKFSVYNFDALWWTHWTLSPYWGMAQPAVFRSFVNGALEIARNNADGVLPRGALFGAYWPIMPGAQATTLIAHAIQIGLDGIDHAEAFEAMKRNHMGGPIKKGGTANMRNADLYLQYGYLPFDGGYNHHDSPPGSETATYSFCDWAVAQVAKKLGRDEEYRIFMNRAKSWLNIHDPETGYLRPRAMDGSWLTPFLVNGKDVSNGKMECFAEGNTFLYTWFVGHDIAELARLMGGWDAAANRLESQFQTPGQTDYGNQPAMHMAHIFNHLGKPWLSQYWVRQTWAKRFDHTARNTNRGDEDQGQMGALSVLMSTGLFTMRGGLEREPIYDITTPIFDTVTFRLDSEGRPGGTFVIRTVNNSPENHYIQSATLNGKPISRCYLLRREFAAGGELALILGPQPNEQWGLEPIPGDAPDQEPQTNMK